MYIYKNYILKFWSAVWLKLLLSPNWVIWFRKLKIFLIPIIEHIYWNVSPLMLFWRGCSISLWFAVGCNYMSLNMDWEREREGGGVYMFIQYCFMYKKQLVFFKVGWFKMFSLTHSFSELHDKCFIYCNDIFKLACLISMALGI